MISKTLISIVGPTAIGKTRLAIALAQHFTTEIISADSRQFYKEMKIGTAVPSDEELRGAPHHFIQHKSIFDKYTVGDFEKEALKKLEDIFSFKDIVIMVGGSGLYVNAVIKGLDEFPEVDQGIREQLNTSYREKGITFLQDELQKKDPVYFKKVDLNNPHRLIRALEVCIGSGKPYSSFIGNTKSKTRPFKVLTIGIEAERQTIYDRINKRVDMMMEDGLLEEAKNLHKHKNLNALQTVGYKELFHYFEGTYDLNFAVDEIKKNTRRFAKRQLTWFRKEEKIHWVDYDAELSQIIQSIDEQL